MSVDWFTARLNEAMMTLDDQYDKYRISDALMVVYRLIWDDFCSWYLEMIKPGIASFPAPSMRSAPAGAPASRLKVRVLAGTSASLAVAVKLSVLPSLTL